MGQTGSILKYIDGDFYSYDRRLDIISYGSHELCFPFDRTQVNKVVDLCIEITTNCNLECDNCFSFSEIGKTRAYLTYKTINNYLGRYKNRFIRVSLTGGEPLTHPDIERILELPCLYEDIGFVITTNGTLRHDIDSLLIDNNWLTAISLHGRRLSHNQYTRSDSFAVVKDRINKLASSGLVHIYSVLHEQMSEADVDWLFTFRDGTGTAFLRFIVPRKFGRNQSWPNEKLISYVKSRLDAKAGLKDSSSKTEFMAANGTVRISN